MTTATVANMREVEAKGKRCFAFSPFTGERASATSGDYFWLSDAHDPLVDELGEAMVLAVDQTVYRDALTEEVV